MRRSACFAATVLAALSACKMENPAFDEGSESADAGESATTKGSEEGAESHSGSSEVSTTTGDGDGDGDGEVSTDVTTGDGDGDGDAEGTSDVTTGDGDGDGDETTGDGDEDFVGDPTRFLRRC